MTLRREDRPIAWLVALFALGTSGIDHAPPPPNPAIAPRAREDAWVERHESFVARARRGGVDLLFLGDSITDYWGSTAPDLWERHYAPRRAVNFGIGADHTQHLLWRIDHGELDRITPRVVVLMIGTNNLPYLPEDQVVEGVKAVVGRVRSKLPGSKILLLGLTPRGLDGDPRQVTTAADPRVAPINRKLAKLEDGEMVRFLDFGPGLLDGHGRLVQKIEPDFLHLSHEGYRIWAEAMEPVLREMMRGEGPVAEVNPS